MNHLKDTLPLLADLNLLGYFAGKQSLAKYIYSYSSHAMAWAQVYRLYLHPLSCLPGPPRDPYSPFFGHLRQGLSEEWGVKIREWVDIYGPVFRVFANANNCYIVVSDPEFIKYIFMREEYDFTKAPEIKQFLAIFTGANGILLKDGDEHKKALKRIYPTLGLSAVQGMTQAIIQPIQQLVQQWSTQCSSSPTEIVVSDSILALTMEVLGRTGFGQIFGCLKDPKKHPISRAYLDFAAIESPLFSILIIVFPWILRLPFPVMRQMNQNVVALHQEIAKMVTETRQDPNLHKRTDLLGILTQQLGSTDGKGSNLEELYDECLFVLGAGHETTSACLSWTFYELARNQDVQDELRQELNDAFPNLLLEDEHLMDILTYDKVNKLPFLENVVKESLRVSPPVPLTSKISLKDFTWKDQIYPKGTRFLITSQATHFDKFQWGDDCDQFLPSRWDRAPANTINPFVYFPFYQGPRHCVGYRLATIVVKMTLVLLIKNFKFTLKPGFTVRKAYQISLKPIPNMTLMVEKIDS